MFPPLRVWGVVFSATSALAMPEMSVVVGPGGGGAEITVSHFEFGSSGTVFDQIYFPAAVSNVEVVLNAPSRIGLREGDLLQAMLTDGTQSNSQAVGAFEGLLGNFLGDGDLNNYLDFGNFTFDDAFSYEAAFAQPILDDSPGTDEHTELIFTARGGNSYMFVEALEAPGGARLPGSTGFLVDTNGWVPATDASTGGNVAQTGNTELYFKGADLSLLGITSAQYFRFSSVSASAPGVSDTSASPGASGISAIAVDTSAAVPEPSAALLALVGLALLGNRRRPS